MARTIEYDPKEVLTKAMNLFWEKGYVSTSIQDIVKVTGLKPGSLYAAYGNKEGIFKAVIEMYTAYSLQTVTNILESDGDILENIEAFLNLVIVTVISNEANNGCLLVKTLLVVSHKDEKIQKQIAEFYKQLEPTLENSIIKAKERGQTLVEPDVFTTFIFSTIYGSHVHYKTFKQKEMLEQNVALLMKQLRAL